MIEYEQRLKLDPRWALNDGGRHFDEQSTVFQALRKIAPRLDELGVPYAVVGGMALFQHGLRRFTEDIGILVDKADLKTIHEKLEGAGYLPAHRQSKNLRDTELGVRIEFLTTGEYPGDGKKKPVAFPAPEAVRIEIDGVKYVKLPTLVELKLASGMTNPGRLKDLADVQDLIRVLRLPEDFALQLNPFVRQKFLELARLGKSRYIRLWRLDSPADTDQLLQAMLDDGAAQETDGVPDGTIRLVTTDPDIAAKYAFVEESEYWSGE